MTATSPLEQVQALAAVMLYDSNRGHGPGSATTSEVRQRRGLCDWSGAHEVVRGCFKDDL